MPAPLYKSFEAYKTDPEISGTAHKGGVESTRGSKPNMRKPYL